MAPTRQQQWRQETHLPHRLNGRAHFALPLRALLDLLEGGAGRRIRAMLLLLRGLNVIPATPLHSELASYLPQAPHTQPSRHADQFHLKRLALKASDDHKRLHHLSPRTVRTQRGGREGRNCFGRLIRVTCVQLAQHLERI